MKNLSIILLAGGSGSRMGSEIPKQYLTLNHKPIFEYSLDAFQGFGEIIVVADEKYHSLFSQVKLALPGKRRQDSVFNGLKYASHEWVMVHDMARPFITKTLIQKLWDEGQETGAATLANPVSYTVKEADKEGIVKKTLDRSSLWEIQTPQLIKKEILEKGFEKALKDHIDVTDDVALAELIHHPVKLIKSSPINFKITTQEDLKLAEALLAYV